MVVVAYITVFSCIAITKNPISYINTIDYKNLANYASIVI